MLREEENRILVQVGPGTPMGELLRRYWWPLAAVAELAERSVKPVRLLGEDLVLYLDRSGTYGLVDRHCPHRRASMEFGMVEARGLRCSYHGWMFDETGACTEQPFEETVRPESPFKDKVRIKAYHVQAKAGLLWAYMGPDPAPCLWDWATFYDRGYKFIAFGRLPCNWLQCQENSIDPVHVEWLHENWRKRLRGQMDFKAPTHLKAGFDEFEHGFVYRRVLEGHDERDELWTVGRVCLWPNCLYVGVFEWSVPIDDYNTLHISWHIHPLPGDRPFEQERVPYWYVPLTDPITGEWITRYGLNQDFVAMVGQGTIADRTKERLGESDRGIIMLRQRFLEDLKVVANGRDPKNILRDASRNHRLPLPTMQTKFPEKVTPAPIAGQPEEILAELERVWAQHSKTP